MPRTTPTHYLMDLKRLTEFGERLRLARLRRKFTVEMVAKRVGAYSSHASFTRGQTKGLPPNTQGGSPVRELRPPGSVRGVSGNGYPYRDIRKNDPSAGVAPLAMLRRDLVDITTAVLVAARTVHAATAHIECRN